jgi:hypothetical protein
MMHTSRKYQQDIIDATWNKPHWALFCEMGLGKSHMLFQTVSKLYKAGKIDAVLYVSIKGAYANPYFYELKNLLIQIYNMTVFYTPVIHLQNMSRLLKRLSHLHHGFASFR